MPSIGGYSFEIHFPTGYSDCEIPRVNLANLPTTDASSEDWARLNLPYTETDILLNPTHCDKYLVYFSFHTYTHTHTHTYTPLTRQ